MRYHRDSIERSTQHLRAALPLMTRQRTALHPVSYAVWYEFVSGHNAVLNRELQALTEGGSALTEAQTWSLYSRHIDAGLSAADAQAAASAERLGAGMERVLGDMAATAVQAGADTARFDASLAAWVDQLLDQPAPDSQAEMLREVLEGTREIRGAMGGMQQRLEASQSEIDVLRGEVQRARSEALVDALTALANRRAFESHLSHCVSARPGAADLGPCLVIGDIDFFKKINDSYGHPFGDQVLRAVGQTMAKAVKHLPTGTMAARIGGEEFALLLPSSAVAGACRLAEQMRATVAASRIRRGEPLPSTEQVTLSLGVTQFSLGDSESEFFERADRALYQSKRDGRNRVTLL